MQVNIFKRISCKDLTINFIGEDGIEYTYKVPKCYFECEKNAPTMRYHHGYMTLTDFLNSATMHIDIDERECLDQNQNVLFTVEINDTEKEY